MEEIIFGGAMVTVLLKGMPRSSSPLNKHGHVCSIATKDLTGSRLVRPLHSR